MEIKNKYGYVRVSSKTQESNSFIESQKQQLIQNGIETKQLKNPSMRELVLQDFQTEMELPEDEMTTEMIEKTI